MPDYSEYQSENGVIADLMSRVTDVQKVEIGGLPHFAVPEGVTLIAHESLMPNPVHAKASPKFEDAESFSEYVNKFKDARTILIANRKESVVRATIDYHVPGSPQWGHHTATYVVAYHEDYQAWKRLMGMEVGQVQFAEAIEDLIHTIASPDGAVLKDMVLRFQSTRESRFTSIRNLENGDVTLSYSDNESTTEQSAKMVSKLTLSLRIYEGQPPRTVEVRVRYRVANGKLTFNLAIVQLPEILRAEFAEVLDVVTGLTTIKPLMGIS